MIRESLNHHLLSTLSKLLRKIQQWHIIQADQAIKAALVDQQLQQARAIIVLHTVAPAKDAP